MEWKTTTKILEELKCSNDGAAWSLLCTEFYPLLIAFSTRRGLPKNLSEDVAQETLLKFIELYRKGNYVKKKGRLHDWLYGIAKIIVCDTQRRLPREQLIADDTDGTSFFQRIEDEHGMRSTWDTVCHRMRLQRCLERVSHEFTSRVYETFRLHCLEELPPNKVADTMGISINAVYTYKHRVLGRLKELINECFED